eukprot:5303648-Amphidinium_carterae.1
MSCPKHGVNARSFLARSSSRLQVIGYLLNKQRFAAPLGLESNDIPKTFLLHNSTLPPELAQFQEVPPGPSSPAGPKTRTDTQTLQPQRCPHKDSMIGFAHLKAMDIVMEDVPPIDWERCRDGKSRVQIMVKQSRAWSSSRAVDLD